MAVKNHNIVVVDDDIDMRDTVKAYLAQEDFSVAGVGTGQELWEYLAVNQVDLVILDGRLPDIDGFQLTQHVSSAYDVGIVVVTARSSVEDRIVGLEMGADDYVIKPFSNRELLARVRSVLRRRSPPPRAKTGTRLPAPFLIPAQSPSRKLSFGGGAHAEPQNVNWSLDKLKRDLISPRGQKLALAAGDFDLLLIFAENPGVTMTRQSIMRNWKGRDLNDEERTIDMAIHRLKKKFAEIGAADEFFIQTIRARGLLCSAKISII
ncbi:response regulator transcription factor [Desulfovibrio sp.]|uniref:response regulator transcription factor n=1 Tax=Desulfovibrio sp. TaxID=885 RepID=UPI0025C44477|nr:response regulator transcription factor [Desulfovibrio sp.]